MARECWSDPQCEHVKDGRWQTVVFWLGLAVAFAVFWTGLVLLVPPLVGKA